MLKTCLNPNCPKENHEFNARRKSTRYCSVVCSNQHQAAKIKAAMGGFSNSATDADVDEEEEIKIPVQQKTVNQSKVKATKPDDDEPAPYKRTPIPLPRDMNFETQFAFSMMQRENDRVEREMLDYKKKASKRKEEVEKLRTELAQIKTDTRISEIEREHAKPSGLSGFTDSVKGLLDNQYIGPVIAGFLGNMMNGQMMGLPQTGTEENGDAGVQQAVLEIFQWFTVQDAPVQQNFKVLVDMLASVQDKVKVNDIIVRLISVLKGGSTVSSVHKMGANGNMSYAAGAGM